MAKIKVLLIEDNRLLREGIAAALDGHGDFEVIAQAEDGDTVKQIKKLGKSPDVVLLDLGLAKINSLKLMALLRTELPDTRIIAMDILPEQDDIIEFVEAGGAGFILKSASLQDYVETIQTVAGGEKVLPTVLTASLFTHIVESALSNATGIPDGSVKLTNREKEIVGLISDGMSNKEIAQRLHIATHTVKSHVHNILEKLTLSSRLQIAAFARRQDSE
jgi:DNA-binding NarL/FixJ family response regulator